MSGLSLLLLLTVISSTGLGYIPISASEVLSSILSRLSGTIPFDLDQTQQAVIMDVRLPRVLTAALVGGGLAMAGAIFQAILLNPLADPYTLGVSSGAAFGAALALILNMTLLGGYSVPMFAFVGALSAVFAVLALAASDRNYAANSLILAGVIISAILSAGIGFIKYLADEQVSVIIFWLMGSFAARSWSDVGMVLAATIITLLTSLFYGRDLNIMSLGLRSSDSLGVDTARTRKTLLIIASLITAISVSVSGIIGFIGLIIPHLMRFIIGPDNRKLIPASCLAGATLLLVADTISRAVLPREVPIGVLTALIGGPFFCLIFKQKQLGAR
ncbi:MAG: iron ABC transporter permease [Desulfobulbaceae bacterium]|nr:iron ABC transporter permease [Desulfobulbaceae bacterium]